MRSGSKNEFASNMLVSLKGQEWLEKQRVAGKVVADTLLLLEKQVKEKTTLSLIELNKLAEEYIYDNKCTPTFKDYKSSHASSLFPAGVCCSEGKKLVHGIPSDIKLEEGMKISFDLGCTFGGVDGAISDSALTVVWGEASPAQTKLLNACEEALFRGISAIAPNKRLGCVGHAISKCAKGYGYGNIVAYGGHGLDWGKAHASPFVANKADIDEGIRLCPNMTLALEPMFTSGSTKTWVDKDNWTVWCEAEIVCHWEHTIYIHSDHIEVMTYRGNENYLKSNKVYFTNNQTSK